MGKSLTEVAKRILKESNDPTPDRDARGMNPNSATLRPGSRYIEGGPFANPGSNPPAVGNFQQVASAPNTQAFLNPAKGQGPMAMPNPGGNVGAMASGMVNKDMSPSSQSSRGIPSGEPFGVGKSGGPGKLGNPESMEDDSHYDDDEDDNNMKRGQMAEDFEMTEELHDFIAEKVAQGLSEEEIAQAIDENFELVSEDDQLDEISQDLANSYLQKAGGQPGRESGTDMASRKLFGQDPVQGGRRPVVPATGSNIVPQLYEMNVSEHVDALLAGESLSEEFRAKATTIFEAAVSNKLHEEVSRLEEAYAESLAEEVAAITENLSENIDNYLSYVVEQWMSENEIAIEHGLRTELTEDFITGLRQLFAENYIDIPEDRVSVVEELGRKVEELESKLNEEIDRNVSLNKMINESHKYEILLSACDGLTQTQVERLKALSEGIDFTNASEYSAKVMTLRESYFPTNVVRNSNVLDRVESDNNGGRMLSEDSDPRMAAYVRTLGKKLPN